MKQSHSMHQIFFYMLHYLYINMTSRKRILRAFRCLLFSSLYHIFKNKRKMICTILILLYLYPFTPTGTQPGLVSSFCIANYILSCSQRISASSQISVNFATYIWFRSLPFISSPSTNVILRSDCLYHSDCFNMLI